MTEVSVGIVGLGRIGLSFGVGPDGDPLCHAEAYAAVGARVSWGLDPDPERRAAFSRRFPGASAFADASQVSGGIRTDVVSVCSPTPHHLAGVDIACRVSARVIVCEKPIAPTVVESRQVVERCRAESRLLVVNYTRRFTSMLASLVAQTDADGLLTGPVQGFIRYNGDLAHNGTHWIDLVRAMFGDVQAVRALGAVVPGTPPVVEMIFSAGRRVVLTAVSAAPYDVGEGEFFSTRGVVRFSDGGALVIAAASVESATWKGYRGIGPSRTLVSDGLKGHMLDLARHAVGLARTGGTPRCTGEDGIEALCAVEEVLRP